jgi:hypothetical protein
LRLALEEVFSLSFFRVPCVIFSQVSQATHKLFSPYFLSSLQSM